MRLSAPLLAVLAILSLSGCLGPSTIETRRQRPASQTPKPAPDREAICRDFLQREIVLAIHQDRPGVAVTVQKVSWAQSNFLGVDYREWQAFGALYDGRRVTGWNAIAHIEPGRKLFVEIDETRGDPSYQSTSNIAKVISTREGPAPDWFIP